MGQAQVEIFVILIGLIILIFIVGVILFVFQYRKRKLLHEQEKTSIEKQHKLDLLNNQLQIQQETMQFIGSEIHDSVAQKLTLASIYSQKLEFENEDYSISDRLHHISRIINDSLFELRDLSKTLTNSHIRDAGINELIKTECERVNDAGTCRALFDDGFERPMSITVKSFLLRVIQEFIQNSLKHSSCSMIKVSLTDSAEGLSVTISDNGIGFDAGNLHSEGIGLNNMKRRIRLIGGTFNLHSEHGKGTSLQLFIGNKNLLSE